MTDIVERLKSLANHFDDHARGAETCRRAIREIESMRHKVKDQHVLIKELGKELGALKAQGEKE